MADESALVNVWVTAAPAVLGVEGVLELGQGVRGVLDPEIGDSVAPLPGLVAAEVGDRRIVGVEHEARAPGPCRHGLGPVLRQRLDLAVAIELVAEEVAEHHHGGIELGRDLREPGLVDLEQALAAALLEQRRGDAPGHVRSRPVVDRVAPVGLEHGGDHSRRRRLAVGRADHRRTAVQPLTQPAQCLGFHAQQDAARQRRAAAAAAGAAGGSDRARRGQLGAEQGSVRAPSVILRRAPRPLKPRPRAAQGR